jgi:hypothetical protein
MCCCCEGRGRHGDRWGGHGHWHEHEHEHEHEHGHWREPEHGSGSGHERGRDAECCGGPEGPAEWGRGEERGGFNWNEQYPFGFRRHFHSPGEELEFLKKYLEGLEKEAAAVREIIAQASKPPEPPRPPEGAAPPPAGEPPVGEPKP